MRIAHATIYGLALLAASLANAAASDVCNGGNNADRLESRYFEDSCRKAVKSLQELPASVREAFGPYESNASADAWPDKAEMQLKRIRSDVRDDQQQADAAGQAQLASRLGELDQRLSTAISKLTNLRTIDELGGPNATNNLAELQPSFWRVDVRRDATRGELALKYLQDENCVEAGIGDSRCEPVYVGATKIADHTYATAVVIAHLHEASRRQVRTEATRRTAAWNSYLYDTQFQYWWELVFNRYLEERCPKGLNAWVAPLISKKCEQRSVDSFKNEIGFREPPDYKASLLHPDLGVMYLDDEPKGDRFKPAVLVQALGYEWWDWKDGKIENRRGVSLVVSAADNSRTKQLGYGLQLRWNGYAFAVTDHDGKLAVTLNLDLAKYIGTASPKYAESFKLPLELEK
jgi:hypothetical protein